jgi:hypothetical protein
MAALRVTPVFDASKVHTRSALLLPIHVSIVRVESVMRRMRQPAALPGVDRSPTYAYTATDVLPKSVATPPALSMRAVPAEMPSTRSDALSTALVDTSAGPSSVDTDHDAITDSYDARCERVGRSTCATRRNERLRPLVTRILPRRAHAEITTRVSASVTV